MKQSQFNINPTKEPILKSLVMLSIPMILEMVAQNIFLLVDTFFVSLINYEAVGALVTSSLVIVMCTSIASGIATASGIFVANLWGAKKYEEAGEYYKNSLFISSILAIMATIILFIFVKQLFFAVGLRGQMLSFAIQYMKIYSPGFIIIFLFLLNSFVIRAISYPTIALKVIIISNIINIVLDPFLIFYMKMGIKGAALSTIISIGLGIIAQFYLLHKNKFSFKGRIVLIKVKQILSKGFFAFIQMFIRVSSLLMLTKIISFFSQETIAAYDVVIRVYQVLLYVIFGISNATFTVVGQNAGAGLIERTKKSAYLSLILGISFLTILNIILYLFKNPILSLFLRHEHVKDIASNIMFYYLISYPLLAGAYISSKVSMALKDTKNPGLIELITRWFFLLPFAYYLSMKMGENGIWTALASSYILAFSLNFAAMKLNLKKLNQHQQT